MVRPHHFLITGPPGCGKTTLVKHAVAQLSCTKAGFYTQEMRDSAHNRAGFVVVTLDGREAVIANVEFAGSHRVGKYGVDVAAIDTVAAAAVEDAIEAGVDLIVIDEIGPMELLSDAFCSAVLAALDSRSVVLGTIVMRPHSWADKLKTRDDVNVIHMDREGFDPVLRNLVREITLAVES